MTKDGVILLHGIFRTHRSMGGLARYLKKQGYQVLNIGYPSTRKPLEAIIDHIHPAIESFAKTITGKIHIIGYSMGGLVTRAYLHRYPLMNIGRVVMLGTPNNGSEVADFVQHWWLYKKLYGPAGQQLVTRLGTASGLMGEVHYELGIIAGNRPVDFIGKRIIGKENDGKVSVESTYLPGMKEHKVIPVNHTYFPSSRRVWLLTCSFLEQGHF